MRSSRRRPAPTAIRWRRTTTACCAPRSSSARTATRASWCAARPTTISSPAMSDTARVGLLGHGTVGSAFAAALAERADAIAALCGRRPELAGVLRRSEGDFDAILADSEIVVELLGGTDPARDYVLRALGEGR